MKLMHLPTWVDAYQHPSNQLLLVHLSDLIGPANLLTIVCACQVTRHAMGSVEQALYARSFLSSTSLSQRGFLSHDQQEGA